ncbi:MAG: ATP-binding cassette domain-containing protein [Lawsonibacter sp.]|jgi:ABC-type dipeptide/oligopeptide/nickel transport system ATPase subunit|nr:ATP-binding cassette domain-containing protein [Lawsonibacter sp.]
MHLEADNLTFRYPRRNTAPVLDGISFSLRSGKRVGLSAPSGRGKTTLCRLLAGWEKPDRGQVLLDGAPLPRRGFCPVQLLLQHPEEAADPLLKLKAALYEAGPVNREVLEGLRIQESWLERYPSELSGGELQRICVARTLRPELKFLLCDEASAMLDLITQAQLWRFLLDYAQAHRLGLLIVSHDLSLLSRLCTRVLTWADLTRTPEKASGG